MTSLLSRLDQEISGFLDYVAASHLKSLGLIGLLACLIAFPGLNSLPVTDRDEARYVQASKQMMESGDYIDIRNLDQPRWKKPVGIYWLQVTSAKILAKGADSRIWAYRIPSALGIIAAALLTYWALLPLMRTSSALMGGLVTASTATTAVEAHIAKTDAVLLAFCVLVFGSLVRLYMKRPTGFGWDTGLLWIGLGLGFLIKGPIILIPFLGALIWLCIAERSLSLLKALSLPKGLLLFALVAAPWYIAIGIKTDGAFFAESLGKDLLGKVGQASEKHGGPLGYYLMTMWVTFWPWAPLMLLSVPLVWPTRASKEMRILVAWIIPCWIVFALTTTKLPHYVLPVLPALAGLVGMSHAKYHNKGLRLVAAFLFIVGGIVAGVFALAPLPVFQDQLPFWIILIGLLATALLIMGAVALGTGHPFAFAGLGVSTLALLFSTLTLLTAPRTDALFISPELYKEHSRFEVCSDQPVISVGYHEMSLAFLAGTDTRFTDIDQAAQILRDEESGQRVFLRMKEPEVTVENLEAKSGKSLEILATTTGTNYNSGSEVTIHHLAIADDPALQDCATN